MRSLFDELLRLLTEGRCSVVVTLFSRTGSAPRMAGAKMLVRPDGSFLGTVGGGRLEADALRLARQALESRRTSIEAFDLSGTDVAAMDMICGGRGEILVDFIDADDSNRAICSAVRETYEKRQKAWLVTAIDPVSLARQQCLVRSDRTLVGAIEADQALIRKLTLGPAKISIHAEAEGGPRFLVETIRPPVTAYLFGAGHVSQQIAPLCETVGFRTVVLDDRAEFASRARFAVPTELIVLSGFIPLPPLPIDEDSYVVIVTRGHLHDRTVLEQMLRSKAAYIGMIGSRKKRDLVYAALRAQGFRDEELQRVHAPIGIDILAETPEELAVSIVGEMIRARAEREQGRRGSGCSTACETLA